MSSALFASCHSIIVKGPLGEFGLAVLSAPQGGGGGSPPILFSASHYTPTKRAKQRRRSLPFPFDILTLCCMYNTYISVHYCSDSINIYLESVEEPVQLPVLAPHLRLEDVERVPALLPEADGHQELDDGGELVEVQVEPVCQGGQAPAQQKFHWRLYECTFIGS